MRVRTGDAAVIIVLLGAAVLVAAELEAPRIIAAGRWVLMPDGSAAQYHDTQRGLQTSGLAWDGKLFWSVGDQRASFPGHIYVIDPETARLTRDPIPIGSDDPQIRARLDAWSRLDLEDIAVLSAAQRRFVAVLEDKALAALVLAYNDQETKAAVLSVWDFQFPGGSPPVPYRNDSNYRLEGIAIDDSGHRGYVAFERDIAGQPHLYQFDLQSAPTSGIGQVVLESLEFDEWRELRGKPGTLLNVNGLCFIRTRSGEPRLFVLCRDRELFFVLDPHSRHLVGQVELSLRSPEGEPIEWASPEGIAVDFERGVATIISDPDSTDGNYRLRSTPVATGKFAQFVPLLFEVKLPSNLLQ